MLTKWAKRFLRVRTSDNTFPGVGSSNGRSYFEFKNLAGDSHYGGAMGGSLTLNLLTSLTAKGNNASRGFAFGSGTTAPTEDDYTIESIISSGLSFSATPIKTQVYDAQDDIYSIYFDLVINNTSAAEITISEICMFQTIYETTNLGDTINTGINYANSVLLDHTVLESPRAIPAGESKTLRYSFDF